MLYINTMQSCTASTYIHPAPPKKRGTIYLEGTMHEQHALNTLRDLLREYGNTDLLAGHADFEDAIQTLAHTELDEPDMWLDTTLCPCCGRQL